MFCVVFTNSNLFQHEINTVAKIYSAGYMIRISNDSSCLFGHYDKVPLKLSFLDISFKEHEKIIKI